MQPNCPTGLTTGPEFKTQHAVADTGVRGASPQNWNPSVVYLQLHDLGTSALTCLGLHVFICKMEIMKSDKQPELSSWDRAALDP